MNKKYPHQIFKRSSVAILLLSTLLTGCGDKSIDAHLEDARAYVQNDNSAAAIVEYKNAIQLDPSAAVPRFELGKLYLENDNFVSAEKELNKALELGHPASEVIPLLSVAYQQSGAENALGEVDYRAEGMTAVESAEVGFYKLQALVQLEKLEEAETLLDDLITLDTSSVYKGLIESYEHILTEDYAQALSATESLREQAPTNKDVLLQLARLYLLEQKQAEAIGVYEDYTKAYPNDVTSKFAYAALLIEQRDLERAEPVVDELLVLNEAHPLLNTFKGIIESANGNHASALAHLETAVQNGRNDQVVRLVAGFSAYQIQDFEAAQRHLTMVASRLPENHPGLKMLADSMLQLGENDEALEVLNRVEGGATADAALFSKAGYQLLREGNVLGAKQMVEKTEAVVDTSPEDLARLGVLQLSLNDVTGLVNIEEAVQRAPESTASQNTLLRAYIATGELEKAKVAASEWREQAPKEALPLVYLASIAIVEEEYSTASELLDSADNLDGAVNEVAYARIKLLIAQKQYDSAIEFVKSHIDDNPSDVQAITLWYAIETRNENDAVVIDYLEKQVAKESDDINLRLLLARIYSRMGDIAKNNSLLASVQGDESTPMAFWNLKGQGLVRVNEVEKAKALFERWVEFYPQDKNAVLGMLLILDSENNYREGLALTEKVLAKRPDAQISLLKAYFHSMMGQSKPAWEIIQGTSDEVQGLPFVRGIIARLYVIDKQPEKALDHAVAAYEATPNSDMALLMVAILESTGKQAEAFAFLEKHVDSTPTDVRSAMLLAERQIGNNKETAIATYENILAKTPNNFVVLNNLAFLSFQSGDLDKAESMAKKAVSLQPENADSVDTLAQILIAKGDNEAALKLYTDVATRPILNDEVYLNHVELLLKMDKVVLAKRRLASREFEKEVSLQRIETLKTSYGL
ncbi:PEP-CTERM system TPR-repeat protein PrsT [Alteromonas sp. 1_MG-2023]|uniref:XrtA/PEP-CTERM system TPR-repeat protein PrsT n=1 Tax=Alteromonas sp. 1_MG-2023 TaxID=3062669 RepID=UPI0026E13BE3|nr:XrtA/PEP-CTERM system TPR-repeat protein PrsT [Alteromonas sp. 1_MG-2023]MDO6565759.1 PEP-CTERM system TPR-repeat protein PrsT [Alteromonas sp. 1_MG-2023]